MSTSNGSDPTDAAAERVFETLLGFVDGLSIYLGDVVGYYDALAKEGSVTVKELASATATLPRYATEWLEQQAMTGFLVCLDPHAEPADRRYSFAPGFAEVLTDKESLAYLSPAMRTLGAAAARVEATAQAFRRGGGVSWAEFGPNMRTGQAELNIPWFMNELGATWLPSLPALHARLQRPARVADVGTGEGWSAIALAHHYPLAHIDGFDIDEASIEAARLNADALGLSDRVPFHVADATQISKAAEPGQYDLVAFFETVHDLPDPVTALSVARTLVAADGYVLVMDMRARDTFEPDGDHLERLLYGYSLLICLPDSMAHDGSKATGTVMRPSTLARYATDAGFSGVESLPIDHDSWRFYRLIT